MFRYDRGFRLLEKKLKRQPAIDFLNKMHGFPLAGIIEQKTGMEGIIF